jgi:hypothetical protein
MVVTSVLTKFLDDDNFGSFVYITFNAVFCFNAVIFFNLNVNSVCLFKKHL